MLVYSWVQTDGKNPAPMRSWAGNDSLGFVIPVLVDAFQRDHSHWPEIHSVPEMIVQLGFLLDSPADSPYSKLKNDVLAKTVEYLCDSVKAGWDGFFPVAFLLVCKAHKRQQGIADFSGPITLNLLMAETVLARISDRFGKEIGANFADLAELVFMRCPFYGPFLEFPDGKISDRCRNLVVNKLEPKMPPEDLRELVLEQGLLCSRDLREFRVRMRKSIKKKSARQS